MSCLIHIFRALVISFTIDLSPGFTIQCSKASPGFWRMLQQSNQCCLTYHVYSLYMTYTPFLNFDITREEQCTSRCDTVFIFKERFSDSEACKFSANINQCAKKWKQVYASWECLLLWQFKNEISYLWEKYSWSCSCMDKNDPHSYFPLNFLISWFIHCMISLHVHIFIKNINKISTCVCLPKMPFMEMKYF